MTGYFMDDADYAKQRMAAALMGNQSAQGANSGLANAGSALAGAYALKQLRSPEAQGQTFMRERMNAAGTPMPSMLDRLFSLGGK